MLTPHPRIRGGTLLAQKRPHSEYEMTGRRAVPLSTRTRTCYRPAAKIAAVVPEARKHSHRFDLSSYCGRYPRRVRVLRGGEYGALRVAASAIAEMQPNEAIE